MIGLRAVSASALSRKRSSALLTATHCSAIARGMMASNPISVRHHLAAYIGGVRQDGFSLVPSREGVRRLILDGFPRSYAYGALGL